MNISIIVIGFLSGLFVGFSGVGSGSILNSLMFFVFPQFSIPLIIGTSAVHGAILKMLLSYKSVLGQSTEDESPKDNSVWWVLAGAVPFTIIGSSFLLEWFSGFGGFRVILYSALMLLSAFILYDTLSMRQSSNDTVVPLANKLATRKDLLVLQGALLGLFIGLSSVGSGALLLMLFLFVMRKPIKEAVPISLWAGAVILLVASVAHIMHGHIDLMLMGNLLLGSIPGGLLGRYCFQYIPSKPAKVAVSVLIFSLMTVNLVRLI